MKSLVMFKCFEKLELGDVECEKFYEVVDLWCDCFVELFGFV